MPYMQERAEGDAAGGAEASAKEEPSCDVNEPATKRAKAESELGETFDIRQFHDTIIANGSVPLNILEELVDDYIANAKLETK